MLEDDTGEVERRKALLTAGLALVGLMVVAAVSRLLSSWVGVVAIIALGAALAEFSRWFDRRHADVITRSHIAPVLHGQGLIPEVRAFIDDALARRELVTAVNAYREAMGVDLATARRAIEVWPPDVGPPATPDPQARPGA